MARFRSVQGHCAPLIDNAVQLITSHNLHLEFERVLDPILMYAPNLDDPEHAGTPAFRQGAMAVAFSGGLDSTVLLHLAKAYAAEKNIPLFAFHVHHGLNVKADEWSEHCRACCDRLGIRFDSRQVTVRTRTGKGLAASARRERYAALTEMSIEHGVHWLLLAHHEDDQAETVLMRLMRGSGVLGLSGMQMMQDIEQTEIRIIRPLLGVSRFTLETWAREHSLVYVVDDSNMNPRYARNAFRLKVYPHLSKFSPGFAERIHRSALHMQSATRLLNDLAEMDIERCREDDALNLDRMAEFGTDRFDNLLRFWLDRNGLLMPSAAWLENARDQLLHAKEDAQVSLGLQGALIRRYRNLLFFERSDEKGSAPQVLSDGFTALVWQGEPDLPVPEFGGRFTFETAPDGIDAKWLQMQPLTVSAYKGQNRIRVSARRPRKTLKTCYQELGIPAWERPRLPLLFAGDTLLFAAGIGMDTDHFSRGANRIRIGWEQESGIHISN